MEGRHEWKGFVIRERFFYARNGEARGHRTGELVPFLAKFQHAQLVFRILRDKFLFYTPKVIKYYYRCMLAHCQPKVWVHQNFNTLRNCQKKKNRANNYQVIYPFSVYINLLIFQNLYEIFSIYLHFWKLKKNKALIVKLLVQSLKKFSSVMWNIVQKS